VTLLLKRLSGANVVDARFAVSRLPFVADIREVTVGRLISAVAPAEATLADLVMAVRASLPILQFLGNADSLRTNAARTKSILRKVLVPSIPNLALGSNVLKPLAVIVPEFGAAGAALVITWHYFTGAELVGCDGTDTIFAVLIFSIRTI
jgi:hypothetical protein